MNSLKKTEPSTPSLRKPEFVGKTLGIDLDSVLNHLDLAWLEWIKIHDPGFSMEKWLSWNVHEHTTAGHKVYDYLSVPGVFNTLQVQAEAVRVTQRLAEHHKLVVITAFLAATCDDKAKWLHRHFPHILPNLAYPDNLIFCNRKHMVRVDAHIDDGAHNFDGFDCVPLLFDAPWNRHSPIPRVSGWLGVEAWMEASGWL